MNKNCPICLKQTILTGYNYFDYRCEFCNVLTRTVNFINDEESFDHHIYIKKHKLSFFYYKHEKKNLIYHLV